MRIAIYGIGNVLVGDDAIGPSVIRFLESHWMFPEEVVVEDLGTPSLDLAEHLVDCNAVIFIDAVSAAGDPGEIRVYRRDEIIQHSPSLRMSPHDPSLRETLLNVGLLGIGPSEVTLVGVIPRSLQQFGLSADLRAAIPVAADRVLEELSRLGLRATRLISGRKSPGFWEAA